jgi:hypothetical protein
MEGVDIVFHTASPFLRGAVADAQTDLVEPAVRPRERGAIRI